MLPPEIKTDVSLQFVAKAIAELVETITSVDQNRKERELLLKKHSDEVEAAKKQVEEALAKAQQDQSLEAREGELRLLKHLLKDTVDIERRHIELELAQLTLVWEKASEALQLSAGGTAPSTPGDKQDDSDEGPGHSPASAELEDRLLPDRERFDLLMAASRALSADIDRALDHLEAARRRLRIL